MGNACCNAHAQKEAIQVEDMPLDRFSSARQTFDVDNDFEFVRKESEGAVFFDAIDEFPPQEDMLYPPAQSMRQLPAEVDLERQGTLPLLLCESSRRLLSRGSPVPPISKRSSRVARESVMIISERLATETSGTQGRGYPGELTEYELEICLEFRDELKKRDPAFKEMVMSMYPYEPEAFALCRFLRARDFDVDGVFEMMSETNQPENWRGAKDVNFYEDFDTSALAFNGCPLPVLLTQFPLIHSGIGKNGAIVLYFKAGEMNFPGIECIVGDLANALPFCWNRLYHGTRSAMERETARFSASRTVVLSEKIMVIDLEGDAALTSGIDFLKVGPIAGACFPETVNRTYILNAPFSFSVLWAVIKKLLDPRTVKKVGFFSSIAKAKSDFLEHIESCELLSSYGGTGESFQEILAKRQKELAHKEGIIRYVVEHLTMSGRDKSFTFELSGKETVDSIVVYSRSNNSCEISVIDNRGNSIVQSTQVQRSATKNKKNGNGNDSYAVEIASSKDFIKAPAGSFVVNTKRGIKGDSFLVAISIARK
mmetsp:Transcript_9349/g.27911  ORF Transcript_9349/g.27911 Transcript_9349/m.27911 type:complete len:540 (+) Transcript_9349:178-1797(+)|eukprot:CAMPEP_0172374952 /NCGR_PEP_ID=MMETSP1060-20121228/58524_1 /TAXON_ID=37318 /ORGANISM="Pseudo-nitzschia pungens, Strain cf. cingulata" /LENGTH=539 /DNA_ID=CAMNT_0013101841 /DNA_START=170 /DNA_END=1789 /DNA_ORIENTATION=+